MNITAVVCLLLLEFIRCGVQCDANVWLTVSSRLVKIRGNLKQRVLELNWSNVNVSKDNWIGLFQSNIGKIGRKSKAMVVIQPIERDGKYRTEIEFPVKIFTSNDVSIECLGFYIAYCKSRRVIAKNCIRLNAKWMEENYEQIKHRSIRSLMIPGTHNAGSYYEGYREVNFLQNVIDNYAICQDENIFNQLMYGIRYLDLRVMFERGNFWMAHDVFKMNNTLDNVLRQIKQFIDSTGKEVVIIDFHRFPKGFDQDKQQIHKMLLNLLEYHLKSYLSTSNQLYSVTVDELVRSGKRLIVGYAEKHINRTAYLYPPVKHLWAQTDEVTSLYLFMKNNVCSNVHQGIAEAAMAELTPQPTKAVFNVYGGLRQMADNVNSEVTKWFRDELWFCANIIATDFFLGNNIIEVSIASNNKRKHQSYV